MARGIEKGQFGEVEVEADDAAWPCSHHAEFEAGPGFGHVGHDCRLKG